MDILQIDKIKYQTKIVFIHWGYFTHSVVTHFMSVGKQGLLEERFQIYLTLSQGTPLELDLRRVDNLSFSVVDLCRMHFSVCPRQDPVHDI